MTRYETTFKPIRPDLVIGINEHNAIVYVGWGAPPAGMLKEPATLLSGFLATLVYLAVAGRNYDEHPEEADWARSAEARRELAKQSRLARFTKNGRTTEDQLRAVLAQAVVGGYPGFIMPWLGTVALNELGQPITESPRYHQIELADVGTATSIV